MGGSCSHGAGVGCARRRDAPQREIATGRQSLEKSISRREVERRLGQKKPRRGVQRKN